MTPLHCNVIHILYCDAMYIQYWIVTPVSCKYVSAVNNGQVHEEWHYGPTYLQDLGELYVLLVKVVQYYSLECVGCPHDSHTKNNQVSIGAPHTRKSLVKGERFIRYVWRA